MSAKFCTKCGNGLVYTEEPTGRYDAETGALTVTGHLRCPDWRRASSDHDEYGYVAHVPKKRLTEEDLLAWRSQVR